jgi:ABC-type dipeptide/oligopeptide/nickel transport system permease subunit
MSSSSPAPIGAWRRLLRNRPAVASMALLAAIVFLAAFGPLIFQTDPHSTSQNQFSPPSAKHIFGTDLNGRDVFARVLEGARISLFVGFAARS